MKLLMNRTRATNFFYILMAIGSSAIFLSSCRKKSMEGMIVFTRVVTMPKDINYITGDGWKYIPEASIVALNPYKPGGSLKVLTEGFYSARSPEISYDGKYLLFAAQQKQNDPWQICEMNLSDMKIRKITSFSENCTDPAYLPGGRLVFSKVNPGDTLKAGHSLYTCNLDGSNIKRITFNPHTYFTTSVLKDGRVLATSRQLYPDRGDPELMVLRPDGTKAEIFYKSTEGNAIYSREWENANGKIVFIESDKGSAGGGKVISINYNRPLYTRVNLTAGIKGEFQTVFPLHSGKLLVTYRPTEADRYALYEFDPENRVLGKAIYNNSEFNALEAVVIEKYDRPKKLPSEVDMGVKTGLLLCQDISVLNTLYSDISPSGMKATQIELVGIDSSLGVVQVEKDGSFYLKVMADKPFQIRTLDENGRVLNKPCGWIWLRPNERRGCVGCHEDHEQVPENRVPLAVKNLPVNIPVHIIKVKEKKVSLE